MMCVYQRIELLFLSPSDETLGHHGGEQLLGNLAGWLAWRCVGLNDTA